MISVAMGFSKGRSSVVRVPLVHLCGLCLAGVFLTGSRGGLVALVGAVLAAIALAPRNRGLVTLVGVIIAMAGTFYYARSRRRPRETASHSPTAAPGRTDIWKSVFA